MQRGKHGTRLDPRLIFGQRARLIPPEKSTEFFGFYNMLGKFAAILGPLLVGAVSVISGNPRLSILSVWLLFVAGGALLWRLDIESGPSPVS